MEYKSVSSEFKTASSSKAVGGSKAASSSKAKYFDLDFAHFPYDRKKADSQIRMTKAKKLGDLIVLFNSASDKYERMMLTWNYCKDESIEMVNDILSEIPLLAKAFVTKMLAALEGGDAQKMKTEFDKSIEKFNDGFERLCHSMGQDYCQRVFNSVFDVAKGIQENVGQGPTVSLFQIYAGEKKKLEALVNKPRLIDELQNMIKGLKSIESNSDDPEVQLIRHNRFMDAYEEVYDVRLKYDAYFEQIINLSDVENCKLLSKIQSIKLPNMSRLKFMWSDNYPHNAAVREFLSNSLPDKIQ
jgi:hypothetical protein